MSCFKYIVFSFFFFLASLYGEVWTDCSEAFESCSQPVEIAAQNVSLPSPAEIDYKAGLGKEFREALAGRPDINWNAVADNYREWSEHTTTLSGPARMLVACVLTVVTNGMGSKWFAAHGIAEGTATHAALSAGIQAVTVGAGTSLAGNLGDIGKTFDELTSGDFVKSLVSTMLTAGLNLGEAATLKEGAIKGAEKIAIQTTLEGRKVGDILVGNIVDTTSAQVAHTIGDAKAGGALNPITHKAAHAGAGAVSQALTGGDPVAGAIGAAASETAAEAMDKPDATHEERQKIAQKARLIGDTVAFVAGRDVASADSAGRNAVENNFNRHPEFQLMRQEIVNDERLSDAEKRQRLAEVDELAQQTVLAAGKGAALGLATTAAPGITSGYFATQSAARWAGTYAGGGMQAVKQEFRDHPILSTVDVVTSGMLGAGFVKSMARVPQLVEAGQAMYKHHKVVGQLKGNVKQGKLFEEKEFRKSVSENGGGETQLTVEAQDGTRVRLDYVFKNPKSPENVIIREFKSSPTAPLTKNQKVAYPLIEQSGAKVVGAGKGVFVPGLSLPPTRIEIIRPKK